MIPLFSKGMLTGPEIERQIKKGNITITPYDPSCINPNSYNLKLHPQLLVYKRGSDRENVIPKLKTPINTNNTEGVMDNTNNTEEVTANYVLNPSFNITKTCIHDIDCLKNTPIIDSAFNLTAIDAHSNNETIEFEIPEEGYVLQPGVLYIGRTVERTATEKFIPMINGRSSGGRLGISIHICAGFGDIGFDGTWTLEITAVEPVRIYPNMEIAQVCFFTPAGRASKLYRGRYYKQEEATASRFYQPKKEY